MARTRTTLTADAKRDAIVATAAARFAEAGFEDTSMAQLAKAAGVAPNTIYWYFESKDALLVAVVEHLLATGSPAPEPAAGLADRLFQLTKGFDRADRLIGAVHARAEISPTVRAWHDAFHAQADAWLIGQARAHLAGRGAGDPGDAALAPIPRIWSFAIEGMVAHRLPDDERRALCHTLVAQLDALAP